MIAWALQRKLPHFYRSGCNHSKEVNSISARDLYLDLGLDKSQWSRWQRRNIEENRYFTQGVDFIELNRRLSSDNPNPPKEYAVSIEMAKHIAMMAKTQRAHDYRNYFIECEKIATIASLFFAKDTVLKVKKHEHNFPDRIDVF